MEFCGTLHFFYAFSGCDTVSSFFKVGKCKFYDALSTFKDIDSLKEVFKALGHEPGLISQHQLDILERYIVHVYYPKQYIPNNGLNEVRMLEFESNPNVKRSCYQSGWIWSLCHKEVIPPDPCLWGWKLTKQDSYIPRWQELENAVDISSIIKICTCSSAKCKNCFCSKHKYSCLPFCRCKRKCTTN